MTDIELVRRFIEESRRISVDAETGALAALARIEADRTALAERVREACAESFHADSWHREQISSINLAPLLEVR